MPRLRRHHGVQPQPVPPTVDAWTCTVCRLNWAVTVVNPPALSNIGVFPTPQLRTAAFLAILRADVTRRSAKDPAP
jgi:hypothetical protein